MTQKEDIFDRVMHWPVLNILEPFYKKNKEILLYLFFGGLSFLISIGSYAWLNIYLRINELVANILSWIITVLFAFFTNRVWVFKSEQKGFDNFIKQMVSFFGGRVITLVIEEIILYIFITSLRFPSLLIKIIAQIIVIIMNYIISKSIVFKQ